MVRNALSVSALLALFSGCTYDGDGVYIVYLSPPGEEVQNTTYVENILDSDPDVDDTTTTDWIFSESEVQSDEVLFMQIFDDKSGAVIVTIQGEAYIGSVEKGVITVSWTGSHDTSYSESNASAEYAWTEVDITTTTNTLTLNKNKETNGYSGNWATNEVSHKEWIESDRWDEYAVGTTGQIATYIQLELVGTGSNNADQDDCSSDPCSIVKDETTNSTRAFEAVETDLDSDEFVGVSFSGQSAGA